MGARSSHQFLRHSLRRPSASRDSRYVCKQPLTASDLLALASYAAAINLTFLPFCVHMIVLLRQMQSRSDRTRRLAWNPTRGRHTHAHRAQQRAVITVMLQAGVPLAMQMAPLFGGILAVLLHVSSVTTLGALALPALNAHGATACAIIALRTPTARKALRAMRARWSNSETVVRM